MYTMHFGLEIPPFEKRADRKFYFDQGDHARIRELISHSIKKGHGLKVVTGPPGSGKTILSQIVVSDFINEIEVIWMAEPPKNVTDLFRFVAGEFGLNKSESDRVFVVKDIKQAIMKITSEGRKCLLIINNAHLMEKGILSGISILNDLKEGNTRLIQVLLLGQAEMINRMNSPEMESFKQRIAVLESIGKMPGETISAYIAHRIKVAGGDPSIFSTRGLEALVLAACSGGGVPSVINALCDRSLRVAFERKSTSVGVDEVLKAAEEMKIAKEVFHYKFNFKRRQEASHIPSALQNPVADSLPAMHKSPHGAVVPALKDLKNRMDMALSGGLKKHCKNLLNRILNMKSRLPVKRGEAPSPSYDNNACEGRDTDFAVTGDGVLLNSEERPASVPAERESADQEAEDSFAFPPIEDGTFRNKTESGSPHEWVTTNFKGEISFSLSDVLTVKKEDLPEKPDVWITADSGSIKSFSLPDSKPGRINASPSEPVEWVRGDKNIPVQPSMREYTVKRPDKKIKGETVEWVTKQAAAESKSRPVDDREDAAADGNEDIPNATKKRSRKKKTGKKKKNRKNNGNAANVQ